MAGYLYKLKRKPQSLLLPQWNRRYFTIEGRMLRWYKTKQTQQPSGEVALASITLDRFASSPLAQLAQSFSFTIGTPTRSLLLRAESQLEMDKWIRVLSINADRSRGGDGHGRLPGGGDSGVSALPGRAIATSSAAAAGARDKQGAKYRPADEPDSSQRSAKGGPLSAAMDRIEEQLRQLQALEATDRGGSGGGGNDWASEHTGRSSLEANIFTGLAAMRSGSSSSSSSSYNSSSSSSSPKKPPAGASPYRNPDRRSAASLQSASNSSSSSGSSSSYNNGGSSSPRQGAGRGVRLAGGLVYTGEAHTLSHGGASVETDIDAGSAPRSGGRSGGSGKSGSVPRTISACPSRDFPSISDLSDASAALTDSLELGAGQVVRGERGKQAWL